MNYRLKEKLEESVAAVLPITVLVLVLSFVLVPLEIGNMVVFLFGAAFLVLGMGLFQMGAEIAMEPLGEGIGVYLAKIKRVPLIIFLTLLLGGIITMAEPDLAVLAEQVPSIPSRTMIITVSVGVGLFLAISVARIIFKVPLTIMLMVMYAAVLIISFFMPRDFLAIAFDSGGVTTGPVTVPFIMALGIGISAIRDDKDSASDSFGLIALSSVGPVLAVMILNLFVPADSAAVSSEVSILSVQTTRDLLLAFLAGVPEYGREILLSMFPIIGVLFIFQIISRYFKHHQLSRIIMGFGYTFLGLSLFLSGVNIGFAPIGNMLGSRIASLEYNFVLVPVAALIGYFIVKAEPAIKLLTEQVEEITDDMVTAETMEKCLSIGVSISAGLAMLRIVIGIPIEYIIIPGYIAALILSRLVPPIFVGIAFDSGGVASGPMASTFLLPMSIGACSAVGGNVVTDAFGVVALVALTPLITIQIMGLFYNYKLKKHHAMKAMDISIPEDADDIVLLDLFDAD